MSYIELFECDRCYETSDDYHTSDAYVSGEHFGHLCYGCYEELMTCDYCENLYWSEEDSIWYCEASDYYLCEDCAEEYHADNELGYRTCNCATNLGIEISNPPLLLSLEY